MKIILTAGIPIKNVRSVQEKNKENFLRFERGEILIIDWDLKKPKFSTVSYVSPPGQRNPAVMFKGGEIKDGKLNVVTNSEIIIYDIKTWDILKTITHCHFNDLHGVMQKDNHFWLVNTGLEMVQVVTADEQIIAEYNLTEIPTWERFDRSVDFRFIGSTKPHFVHVNHVFEVGSRIYATRLIQKDAICLDDRTRRFEIRVGSPHDGIPFEDKIYFTTTNGYVVILDSNTRKIRGCFDLNDILTKSGFTPGGWCRGVCPLPKNRIIVGFTRLRSSKFKEYGYWIKSLGKNRSPSRLVEFDLEKKVAVKEFKYPKSKSSAIFSVLSCPEADLRL